MEVTEGESRCKKVGVQRAGVGVKKVGVAAGCG